MQKKLSSNSNQDDYDADEIETLCDFKLFVENYERCFNKKTNFKDPYFPPGNDSLFDSHNSRGKYLWSQLQWLRPIQFFAGKYKVFQKLQAVTESRIGLGSYISPYDIKQGALGDCYFLSALSSMADNPECILQLFKTQQVNQFGIYCVKLYHDGQWQAIFIDDYFPCYNQVYGPAFTKSNGNELWVLLLEKAWAKLFGCYERIEAGHCREALNALTGAPTKIELTESYNTNTINLKLREQLIDAIKFRNDRQQYIVTASSLSYQEISKQLADQLGLVPQHAYSIINLYQIQLGYKSHQNEELILLKLRNPWGKKEWKGDWSDNSPLWTSDIKKQVNFKKLNDGVFFMDLKDFCKFFSSVTFCYYIDGNQNSSIRVKQQKRHAVYIKFSIDKYQQGVYAITVNQQNKRHEVSYNDLDLVKYNSSRIFLAKVLPDKNYKFIDAIQKIDKELWVKASLDEGTYILYTKVDLQNKKDDEYIISSYGPEKLNFIKDSKQNFSRVIESSLKFYAEQRNLLYPYQGQMASQIYHTFHINKDSLHMGFGFVYIINRSSRVLANSIVFSKKQGIKFRKPFKGDITIIVQPNSDEIAVVTIEPNGYQLQYQEYINYY